MKNILITGGAGFIGSNLALKLLKRGYRVTVLDSLAAQIHGDDPDRSPLYGSIKNKVRFVHGDVTVREDWEKALKDQDAIVHLAAEDGTKYVRNSEISRDQYRRDLVDVGYTDQFETSGTKSGRRFVARHLRGGQIPQPNLRLCLPAVPYGGIHVAGRFRM